MTKIHMIIPVIMEQATMLERMEPYKQYGFQFSESRISMGPHTIESEFDELFSGPPITIEALKAEQQGADAVIIACMGDPGPSCNTRGRINTGYRPRRSRHAYGRYDGPQIHRDPHLVAAYSDL